MTHASFPATQDLHGLNPALLRAIIDAVDAEDLVRLEALVVPLHAADKADLLEQMGAAQRRIVIEALGQEIDAEILPDLDDAVLGDIRKELGLETFGRLVGRLNSDDAVDVVSDLDDTVRREVLWMRYRRPNAGWWSRDSPFLKTAPDVSCAAMSWRCRCSGTSVRPSTI